MVFKLSFGGGKVSSVRQARQEIAGMDPQRARTKRGRWPHRVVPR